MEIIISFLLCNQGMKGYLTKEHKKLVLPAENFSFRLHHRNAYHTVFDLV